MKRFSKTLNTVYGNLGLVWMVVGCLKGVQRSVMPALILTTIGTQVGAQVAPEAPIVIDAANYHSSSGEHLDIRQDQTVVLDFSGTDSISISGNLSNAGKLYAVSSNPAITSVSISTANITNASTGVISSVSSNLSFLSGLLPTLSMTFNAAQNFTNHGQIIGSGNLTIAAQSIVNAPSAASTILPSIQAAGNLNLISGSSLIANSGVLSSITGNINICTALASDLTINNIAGRIEALAGNINIRNSDFEALDHTVIWGGDLATSATNVFSGEGIVNIQVGELLGLVNVSAKEAHLTAETSNLALGNICLSGDPTFYNTAGDVTIGSNLNFSGAALAIVASRDIITAAGAGTIDTSSNAGSGGSHCWQVPSLLRPALPVYYRHPREIRPLR